MPIADVRPKQLYAHLFFRDLDPGGFPLRVSVETTNRCNLRCPYCPREESGRGFGEMAEELYESLARQCADRDIAFAPQGFGEPFLDPDFGARLRKARRLGVRHLDVVTNATLLDQVNCLALIEAEVLLVTIDLDGADKQVFERNRVNACYEEIVANVQRLFRMRRALGSRFPYVSLSAVGLPEVLPSMAAFRALWEPWLGPHDEIFAAQPVTWAGDRPMAGKRAATEVELATRPPCRHLYKTLQVYWDGRASPCTYDHACRLEVGNTARQSIDEIWHGAPLSRLRELHEQHRSGEIALCRGCPDHLA